MKVYVAIGHWKEHKSTTCVAMMGNTKKSFRQDLKGNDFVPYVIITEGIMQKFRECNTGLEIFEQVTKMTMNYRVWEEVTDYIEQCMDIMEYRAEEAARN